MADYPVYVSPDGNHEQAAPTPADRVRLRYLGWTVKPARAGRPAEQAAEQAAEPVAEPEPRSKPRRQKPKSTAAKTPAPEPDADE